LGSDNQVNTETANHYGEPDPDPNPLSDYLEKVEFDKADKLMRSWEPNSSGRVAGYSEDNLAQIGTCGRHSNGSPACCVICRIPWNGT
jgi:hypothetical protein